MADTETIDARIREKARRELSDRLDNLFKPIERELSVGFQIHTDLKNERGHTFSAWECMSAIRRAIVAEKTPQVEKAAVEAFLTKVDSMQAELDELRETVNA